MTDNSIDGVLRTTQPQPSPRKRRTGVVMKDAEKWPRHIIVTVQILSFVAIIGGWELCARARVIDPFFWSSPSLIWEAAIQLIDQGTVFQDTWFTFRATVIGFLLGSSLGAVIGLSLWWSDNAAEVVQPYIVVFNAVPKIALAPLIILVFGIGIWSKIALAIAFTAVITALAAHAGVKAVDEDLVKLTLSLGGTRRDVFFKIVVPSALPWITSSLHVNIGLALAGVIAGEFISSQYGLGKIIMYAGATYDMALIWIGITILAMLATLLYAIVSKLEEIFMKGMKNTRNEK